MLSGLKHAHFSSVTFSPLTNLILSQYSAPSAAVFNSQMAFWDLPLFSLLKNPAFAHHGSSLSSQKPALSLGEAFQWAYWVHDSLLLHILIYILKAIHEAMNKKASYSAHIFLFFMQEKSRQIFLNIYSSPTSILKFLSPNIQLII